MYKKLQRFTRFPTRGSGTNTEHEQQQGFTFSHSRFRRSCTCKYPISLAAFGVALKRTLALCGAGGPREREAEPAVRRAEHLLSRADNDKVCASCSSCARAVTAHGSRSRCALTPARQVSEPLPRACSLPGGRTQVLLRDVHLAEARSRADAS